MSSQWTPFAWTWRFLTAFNRFLLSATDKEERSKKNIYIKNALWLDGGGIATLPKMCCIEISLSRSLLNANTTTNSSTSAVASAAKRAFCPPGLPRLFAFPFRSISCFDQTFSRSTFDRARCRLAISTEIRNWVNKSNNYCQPRAGIVFG